MTHTPGPWTIEGTRDSDEFWVVKDEGPVCEISQTFGYPDADEANARLIAAAPDLLAALQEWTSMAVNSGLEGCDEILEQAEAAIAKAEEVRA